MRLQSGATSACSCAKIESRLICLVEALLDLAMAAEACKKMLKEMQSYDADVYCRFTSEAIQ